MNSQSMCWAFVTTWVIVEILLMIGLGREPFARWDNLGGQFAAFGLYKRVLLFDLLRHFVCNFLLLWSVIENCTAVLTADVRPLAVHLRRVVRSVE